MSSFKTQDVSDPCTDNPGERFNSVFIGGGLGHEDKGSGPVVECAGVGCRDGASLRLCFERRFEPGELGEISSTVRKDRGRIALR